MRLKEQLRNIGLAGIAVALLSFEPYLGNAYSAEKVQTVSYGEPSIDYTKIRERTAKKSVLGLTNIETVKVEFGLESKVWQGLKTGMSEQEFYNSIKQAPIELKTRTIFAGNSWFGYGFINSEQIKKEFLDAAEKFISNKPSQYDSGLGFSCADKVILEKMLERELKSPLVETVSGKKVYVYPPKSEILLRTNREGNPCFEMIANTNKDTSEDPIYEKIDIHKITDKVEKEVFRRFLWLSILTKDPDGIVPIDNFYLEYQNRNS